MPNVARNRVTRWLTLSKFPKGHIRIEREAQAVRLFLEEQCLAKHGSVSVTHAASIHSATVHHCSFKLITKMMSDDPGMSLENKRALIADASKYCEMRDKAIERLKLDAKTKASLTDFAFDVTPDDEPEQLSSNDTSEPSTSTGADGKDDEPEPQDEQVITVITSEPAPEPPKKERWAGIPERFRLPREEQ